MVSISYVLWSDGLCLKSLKKTTPHLLLFQYLISCHQMQVFKQSSQLAISLNCMEPSAAFNRPVLGMLSYFVLDLQLCYKVLSLTTERSLT